MTYKCITGFTRTNGTVHHFGENISQFEYDSLNDFEKNNFEDNSSSWALDTEDATEAIFIAETMTDSVFSSSNDSDDSSSLWGDSSSSDSSSSNDDFGGFGGGDSGGGGASGDW